MINDQIKQQIAAKLAELVALANRRYGINLAVPPVLFDCTDTRGGYYSPRDESLHFNPFLLTGQDSDVYLAVTVPHELAHYVQEKVYPETFLTKTPIYTLMGGLQVRRKRRSFHGREWKSIMRLFGISDPKTCHSYDTSVIPKKRNVKKFPVYCQCSTPNQVTKKIVFNLQLGKGYSCGRCKAKVSLTAPIPA